MNEPADDSTDRSPAAPVHQEGDRSQTALGAAEPRSYLEIRPSETPVDPTAAIAEATCHSGHETAVPAAGAPNADG